MRIKVDDDWLSEDVPCVNIITGPGIGVILGEAGGDAVLTFSAGKEVGFALPGTLTVAAGAGPYPVTYPARVTGVVVRVGTAPTGTVSSPIAGASLVCDVNKNGSSVFTTQANRPRVAEFGFLSPTAVPDTAAATLVAGDWLTVDVDYIGSTIAGANLTAIVQLAT